MVPTAATDCIVPPKEASLALAYGNWIPYTIVGSQTFDNDCLTRHYLHALSPTAPCHSNDNTCMIDTALGLQI